MRQKAALAVSLAGLVLAGCTSLPWSSKAGEAPEGKGGPAPEAKGAAAGDEKKAWPPMPKEASGPPGGIPGAPVPGGPPIGATIGGAFGGPPPTLSEQAAMIAQRLAALEDDKQALKGHIAQLEGQLREKDAALVRAAAELEAAADELKATREHLDRWKVDTEKLRGKLRSMEKDSKLTLETVIHTLEQFLDRRDTRPLEELLTPRKKSKDELK